MTDLSERWNAAPLDAGAREALDRGGLEYRIVAKDDLAAVDAWTRVVRRGFLEGEPNDEQVVAAHDRLIQRRLTGVYDPLAPDPDQPVATIGSWAAELTVPGGGVVSACAISSVAVAPTHRRRGIARALMEGELRAAATAGFAVSALTVSESTLYGRYGFASAASSASLVLDTTRARWTGPVVPGRIDFITRDSWQELVAALHDRVRRTTPGELDMPAGHWDRFARTTAESKGAEKLRAIQYRDPAGEVRGLATYTVTENHDDFPRSRVDVERVDAETDDAYAALWRFLVELDLIGELRAGELSIDEPVLWMIDDRRAAVVTVRDHHFVRILDVPAALEARRFGAAGEVAIDVDDPLGLAGGRYTLEAAGDGTGTVVAGGDGADAVSLGIRELSAAYLGEVRLATLAKAGGVRGDGVARASRMLAGDVAARLSYWY